MMNINNCLDKVEKLKEELKTKNKEIIGVKNILESKEKTIKIMKMIIGVLFVVVVFVMFLAENKISKKNELLQFYNNNIQILREELNATDNLFNFLKYKCNNQQEKEGIDYCAEAINYIKNNDLHVKKNIMKKFLVKSCYVLKNNNSCLEIAKNNLNNFNSTVKELKNTLDLLKNTCSKGNKEACNLYEQTIKNLR
jgi:sensor domain CHASE-containing protein